MVSISKDQARMIAFAIAKDIRAYKEAHPDEFEKFMKRFFPEEVANSDEKQFVA